MQFQKPKGTEDYYPEEKSAQDELFSRFDAIAKKFGYASVEPPAFETIELLTKKSGEEIKSQIFTLDKRGSEEFGLRFELTAGVARMYIEKQKALPKPVKWSYTSRMWRYEQPQKGRLREFYQLGVELFGSSMPQADAEVISIIIEYFKSLGLTEKDFFIKLNNRQILEGILKEIIGDKNQDKIDEAMRLVDKKSKMEESEFRKSLKQLKIEKIENILEIKTIEELEKLELNAQSTKGLENLKQIMNLLDKKFVQINLSTVRGLAYYTGTVFEAYDIEEKYRALAGGGRYDNMIETFGGLPEPATGFGIGESPLMILLTEKGLVPSIKQGPDYYVAPVNDKVIDKANEIANILRKKSTVEIDLMGRNLSNQIKYASTIKALKAVIVGEKDLANNEVTVRDLTSGEEKKIKLDQL